MGCGYWTTQLRLFHCAFVDNVAPTVSYWMTNYYYYEHMTGRGGAINTCETSWVVIGTSTFDGNSAQGNGGALMLFKPAWVTLRPGVVFESNVAGAAGGAVYAYAYGYIFAGTEADEDDPRYAVGRGPDFRNNTAIGNSDYAGEGGAVFTSACGFAMSGATASGNSQRPTTGVILETKKMGRKSRETRSCHRW